MFFSRLVGLAATAASVASAVELTGYEYVVVGSGAGGGPVAARLALAGHKTLLLEAGDDQGANVNYTIPAYSARSSEDEALAWNFFVRHYADDTRQARDYKTSYETPDGSIYTGLSPPAGSKMLGTLYPRTGTLGGCTAHNALIAVYPHRSDFEYIEKLTGDKSWAPANMRNYFKKLEKNQYLALPIIPGQGYNGWLQTETAPLTIPLGDPKLLSVLTGGAFALGNLTQNIFNLATLLAGNANADSLARDTKPGFYQIPLSTNDGHRVGSREFLLSVANAVDSNGKKQFPLDIRLNAHVTKITFDETVTPPRATGVEFLDGAHLYRASPRSNAAKAGVAGSATASREVIVAGGAYNTPQILKLSGVGPAAELQRFNIPVVADVPGVGTNLQDHYEISVQGRVPSNFSALDGCTFGQRGDTLGTNEDPCLERWNKPVLGDRGIYSSSGLAATMFYKSSTSPKDFDIFAFGGPVSFKGYYPNYAAEATEKHDVFSWAILKAHPRNTAGSVTLRSADPLDVPEIHYNYYETGSSAADADKDLTAMAEAVKLTRDAFKRQLVPVEEFFPGPKVQTVEEVKTYVRDNTWGHHASSTCPIGADSDPIDRKSVV